MRPRPARWFELLVAREDTTLALEALAATGAVELETRAGASLPPGLADLAPLLAQFNDLAQRYRAFWPTDGLHPSSLPEASGAALQRALERVRAWAVEAEPLIRSAQQADTAQAQARDWHAVLAQLGYGPTEARRLAQAAAPLGARLVLLAARDAHTLALPPGLIARRAALDAQRHALLVVGATAALQVLEVRVQALRGDWLAPPTVDAIEALATPDGAPRHLDALAAQARAAREALARLADAHGLRPVLADAYRLQWVLDNVRSLESGPLLCWITGWTTAPSVSPLERAIEASGARALLHLSEPPPGIRAPLLLVNPWWARPFEVFARALGMPSGDEADPSVLLALAVPLLFGYMFGDLGQGLVIAAVGFALRRRFPIARLFVAGGLAAALFGLLFGSVFSLHVLTPLWMAPLDKPLAVLVVPIVGGAALLTLGLGLSAVEAHWRGELGAWLATDGGLLLCYLGLLAGVAWPGAFALAGGGALLFCIGHGAIARRSSAVAQALGELLERLMQLLLNTLSFARVGAFALAHAGLSMAIVALMSAASNPIVAALVLVLGNLIVMLLEGLVVSIQTTRLVLFEFFTRFLLAQGRVFRPLPPPPSLLQETPR
jgi:V/A-type H+-transporting ATPase subunit I